MQTDARTDEAVLWLDLLPEPGEHLYAPPLPKRCHRSADHVHGECPPGSRDAGEAVECHPKVPLQLGGLVVRQNLELIPAYFSSRHLSEGVLIGSTASANL
jgi:hypothetical protein